jgi:hypothetical protein
MGVSFPMRPAGIKRLVVVLGLSLGAFAGAPLHLDAARAESSESRGLELLTRATKSYEAGAYADASDLVDSAFKAGLTGELAARAILLRAGINERSGALARALQDYSNALWMESLPAPDRTKAREGKERVMAAMGLSAPASSGASAAATPSVPATASGNSSEGVLGFFSGVFGSGERKPEPPPQPQSPQSWQTAASQAKNAAQPPQMTSAQAPIRAPAPAKVALAAKPAPAPAPARVAAQARLQQVSASSVAAGSDGYLIVFGAVNTEASGRSSAKYIKTQLSDILINRELDVMGKPGGGFQVQAGPYKTKSAALALCSAMKQRGVPCQVTP